MGGATPGSRGTAYRCTISIHAPRGGSDVFYSNNCASHIYFNPRSPWGERRVLGWIKTTKDRFQSTLPVGGATKIQYTGAVSISISIHAPRGGSDSASALAQRSAMHFNPRSPWGERLATAPAAATDKAISIHAPRGGATGIRSRRQDIGKISIHAPRGGSDWSTA